VRGVFKLENLSFSFLWEIFLPNIDDLKKKKTKRSVANSLFSNEKKLFASKNFFV